MGNDIGMDTDVGAKISDAVESVPTGVDAATHRVAVRAEDDRLDAALGRLKGLIDERVRAGREEDPVLAEMAEAQRLGKISELVHEAGFPAEALGFARSLSGSVGMWAVAEKKATDAGRDRGAVVILSGPPGTGKTVLAVRLGLGFCAELKGVLYGRWGRLVDRYRSGWQRGNEETSRAVLDELCEKTVLIIDEVRGGQDMELLQLVVAERADAGLRTIIVTHLSVPEMGEELDESILDRARGCGGVVVMDWPSFRGVKDDGSPGTVRPTTGGAE